MTAQPHYVSLADYLDLERRTGLKHEYRHGQIYAMAGASIQHNQVVANVIGALYPQLRDRACNVYPSDLRIKVLATGLYTYPDISIVCEPLQYDADLADTITNPVVIIEVLSPSTEDYDRGRKFLHYRTIPDLQAYVLISPTEVRVEHYLRKQSNQWLLIEHRHLESTLELLPVDCSISLIDIYRKIL